MILIQSLIKSMWTRVLVGLFMISCNIY